MKTSEATPLQLDWLVAKCEGVLEDESAYYINEYTGALMLDRGDDSVAYCPSKLWDHGGPIIERERISLRAGHSGWWIACQLDINDEERFTAVRATPLTAAMHCYVASKMGEYVDIPKGLV